MTGREAAFLVLQKFENSQSRLDTIINSIFNTGQISERDKKFVYNISSGVVRHKSNLEWKAGQLFNGKLKNELLNFKIILLQGLYEIDFMDHIPPHASINEYVNLAKTMLPKLYAPRVNGIFRTYLREKSKYNPQKKFKSVVTQLSVLYSFPEWLIKRWIGILGTEETAKLCEAFNQRPRFEIRVNKSRITREELEKLLISNKIEFERSLIFDSILKVTDIQKINKLQLFSNGYCSVQDESAFLFTRLVNPEPGNLVLDACAAPGGKLTAILEELPNGTVVTGLEKNRKRARQTAANIQRLQLAGGFVVQADATQPPLKAVYDRILLDVPCSGLGTIQKNPDIKWRKSFDEIFRFQKLQSAILDSTAKLLKTNGILVYSTCTIDPAENEEVVESFLEKNSKNFQIQKPPKEYSSMISSEKYLRTYPHTHNMDGGFAAIIKKIK